MASPLERSHLADLHAQAAELGIERFRMLPREDLVAAILDRDPDATSAPAEEPAPATDSAAPPRAREPRAPRRRTRADPDDEGGEEDEGEPVKGVLDITPRGHGFIRLGGLDSDEQDVYVSPSQIRRCEMQRGDEVAGPARKPRRGERYPALIHVDALNGVEPGSERLRLSEATAVQPHRRIELAPAEGAPAQEAVLLRSFDLFNPLAHGQRVLVRASGGSGRTTLLRALAAALDGREGLELVVLLIDERPEEVGAWREAAPGADLAIASAEMRAGEQLRLVELAVGRASRRAEAGADVVLLVDSLSRVAAAADDPSRVKPIFAAGRETGEEGSGSLTVIATVLSGDADGDGVARALDTTETSLVVLDRGLAAAGIHPALDLAAGRVVAEEAIRSEEELAAARALRAELIGLPAADAAALVRERIEGSADNRELLARIR